MSKDFKIWGIRGSLIGDSIMALPMLNWLEKRHPGSYKYWQIARKCAQSAPIYFNHPLIDRIVISDCDEGMGPKDIEIAQKCDIVFNVMPDHPLEQDWPNYRNIYEETWVMAGLPLSEYHAMTPEEQRPKLTRWFETKRIHQTIAIWPCAGYGSEGKRHPSRKWYNNLVKKIKDSGWKVYQFGHPNDFKIEDVIDFRERPFFDQIRTTLGCDLVISTDSGSGLIFGAYEMPQISLLTNHFPGHKTNLTAFGPNNPNNHNFVGVDFADKISHDEVVEKIKNVIISNR